ncbi:hypothetical protein PRIPAC_85190 [Pristionchus pacificus]|uniref:Uncharacterized protein n=1 Tax=Pristionchus pacificus TaxID=54126 RepID=A0A2A6BUA3_PRIPA|nr:hypothetical protein PRIPAC_85190 [Pristionchus pacificus]|eukprot:PDM69490.1 hypothetical protein PRIPAC_44586 [Pristionchus pacificus]
MKERLMVTKKIMIYSDKQMAQIMKTRQKAFNLTSEDEIGNVLPYSDDLLRALIHSHADPEKLNLATNTLEQERLLVKVSDNNVF